MTDREKMIEVLADMFEDYYLGRDGRTLNEVVAAMLEDYRCGRDGYTAMEAAAAILDLCGPKPLVWTQIGDGEGRDIYSTVHYANSPHGRFFIGLQPPRYTGKRFSWDGPSNTGRTEIETLEAAKAAAQAHADAAHWANTKLEEMK